jgi:hypothetical protein
MILIDFNGLLFQNIHGITSANNYTLNENGKYNADDFMPKVKMLILETIFNIQLDYSNTYGEIVICLDNTSSGNWRKSILPSYKGSRALKREESPLPFNEIFADISKFVEQLTINSPYRVLSVENAEADDVILSLCMQYAKSVPILIVSSDKDMIQAQQYGKVKQYSPLKREWITSETKGSDMNFWLLEHVILGDSADCVPKIFDKTEFTNEFISYMYSKGQVFEPKQYLKISDSFKEEFESDFKFYDRYGHRKVWKNPRIGEVKLRKIIEDNQLDSLLNSNPLYRENYERNKKLILAEYIPSTIRIKCIEAFLESKKQCINTKKFVEYLDSNRMSSIALTLPTNFYTENVETVDNF